MDSAKKKSNPVYAKIGNVLLIGLLLLLVLNPDAKSWMLRQLVSVGLFRAEIDHDKSKRAASDATAAFSFTDQNGNTVSVSELKGKVVFINFWASWCPPCRAEMPSMNAMYNKLKDDNRFVFVFINEDDNLATAKKYLQSKQLTLPLFTHSGAISPQIFNGVLPTTTVLDKQGNIVMMHEGMANYNTDNFLKQLRGLL
jgi:thiol-disulfide isomerase/thioredoxin